MKKLITLIAAISLAVNADPAWPDDIPGASYAIFEGGKAPSPFSRLPKNVTFYTFDGNPIITLAHPTAYRFGYPKVNPGLRLDPSAPKPQPATYEIKSASKIFYSGKCTIIFYDKHDNVIAGFECYKTNDTIAITFQKPDVQPGRIGSLVTLSAPNFEGLKNMIEQWNSFPLDLSRVTEKPKHSKKWK
jgi:hypothetical protein